MRVATSINGHRVTRTEINALAVILHDTTPDVRAKYADMITANVEAIVIAKADIPAVCSAIDIAVGRWERIPETDDEYVEFSLKAIDARFIKSILTK